MTVTESHFHVSLVPPRLTARANTLHTSQSSKQIYRENPLPSDSLQHKERCLAKQLSKRSAKAEQEQKPTSTRVSTFPLTCRRKQGHVMPNRTRDLEVSLSDSQCHTPWCITGRSAVTTLLTNSSSSAFPYCEPPSFTQGANNPNHSPQQCFQELLGERRKKERRGERRSARLAAPLGVMEQREASHPRQQRGWRIHWFLCITPLLVRFLHQPFVHEKHQYLFSFGRDLGRGKREAGMLLPKTPA